MTAFQLPANGKCPKCGAPIKDKRYEAHDSKPEAAVYYDCPKCGEVLADTIDISSRGRSKANPSGREE
jgi:predicted RNA-binding Zn-ribbon protein involved in translation (DUF1610 family)